MKDVARYAGVSVSTVSRVVNDYPHVTDKLRERVLQAAEALGYRTNILARTMRSGRSHSLGLIVRDMLSANFAAICAAAEAVAETNDYDLFVCNSNRDPGKERRYIKSLLERKVDGLILFTADDRINNLDLLENYPTPVVLVSSGLTGVKADRIDTCDEIASMTAARHLAGLGHARIAYLAWGQHIPSGKRRLTGFESVMRAAGKSIDPILVRHCGVDPHRSEIETRFALELDPPPTAVLVSTTDLLPGALTAVRSLDLAVPDDVSVLAFDDREVTRFFDPPITVMKRDVSALGSQAVELLLKRLADPSRPPSTTEVAFSLLARGSTAAPRQLERGPS
jgi:LacI family transcriptional regulator